MLVKSVFSYQREGDRFTLYRDADIFMTPRALPVSVPTLSLAEAIVRECSGSGERMDPAKMPVTQMTLTAIDITAHHRQEVIDGIMRHGRSDLLCQRAAEPADLVEAQHAAWQPYLDWCHVRFKAALAVGQGISPVVQDEAAMAALRAAVEKYDAFHLTGISEAVGVSGSLVLGLALTLGHASAKDIFVASEFECLWQSKNWGEDPTTQERHSDIMRDLELCEAWFALLK